METNHDKPETNPVRVAFTLGTEFANAITRRKAWEAVAIYHDMEFYAREIARIERDGGI